MDKLVHGFDEYTNSKRMLKYIQLALGYSCADSCAAAYAPKSC